MRRRFGNLTTSKGWNESLADLRDELRKWDIEDYILPTKAESQKAGKVRVPFALKGTWANPECSRFDSPEQNLRAIVQAVRSARLMDQRGLGDLLAETVRPLALNPADGSWAVLGLRPDAEFSANHRAYRQLLKTHHPDAGGDPERFQEIRKAGEALGFN